MAIAGNSNTVLMPGLDCSQNGSVWTNFANFGLFLNKQTLGYFELAIRYHFGWKLEESLETLVLVHTCTVSSSIKEIPLQK